MFNKYQNMFRSRWRALIWSAGVLLTAYCAVPSAEKSGSDATAQRSADHPRNPWALDPN